MAKMYFFYSCMNAGKSTLLLQSYHNYMSRGMKPMIFSPQIDDRNGVGVISSRVGISAKANIVKEKTNFLKVIKKKQNDVNCIFIDEAQFLKPKQIYQLSKLADDFNIPVLFYGLRTDFKGKPFKASSILLSICDTLEEVKTICWCGKKATMSLKVDKHGNAVKSGDTIDIGGDDKYFSVCRKHWKNGKHTKNN